MDNLLDQDVDLEDATPKEIYSLRDLSETVFGLIAEDSIIESAVEAMWFAPPYDKGVKLLQQAGRSKNDLAKVLPADVLTSAHNKVVKMNGSRALYDWVDMLKSAYNSYSLGEQLERAGYLAKQNKPVDLAPLYQRLSDYIMRGVAGTRTADQFEYKEYQPFMPSGIDYIDTIVGGWPTDGPIVVYGDTGVGKSHFGAKAAISFLLAHPDKHAAIFSFEMGEEHYLNRTSRMFPMLEKVKNRLYVSGSLDKPGDLVPDVMTHNYDFVVVDDMDNMFEGEASPGKYEGAFKIIKRIARLKKIPVMALSQAKQRGDNQMGRFLTKYDAAWSAANERSAALLIALQNAGGLDHGWKGDTTFPTTDDPMQYIIFWKSRDDWPIQRGPGAIILEMGLNGNQHKNTIWSGPLYKGESKLWRPTRAS